MNVNISVAVFAFAVLFQLSHSIPTHRFARESERNVIPKIKEYMNKIPGTESCGSSESAGAGTSETVSSSESESQSSISAQIETLSGQEMAASELHPSVATKEGSSAESGFTSSFQNYIPSFESYLSQYVQYPSQFNPSQYFPSSSSATTSSTSQGSSSANP